MLKIKCPYCKAPLNENLGFSEMGEKLFNVRFNKEGEFIYEENSFLPFEGSTFYCRSCLKDLPYIEEEIWVANKYSLSDTKFKKYWKEFEKMEFEQEKSKCRGCGEEAHYRKIGSKTEVFCGFECFVKYKEKKKNKKEQDVC